MGLVNTFGGVRMYDLKVEHVQARDPVRFAEIRVPAPREPKQEEKRPAVWQR